MVDIKKTLAGLMGLWVVLILSSDTAFAANQENGQPCPPECVTDSMEIVTWYPSPYNEYEELRLYPISDSNSACGSDTRGLMYYDSDEDKVKLCKGPAGLNNWQELGGAGYWELSGNAIYNNNSGNVGIGKTNPQAKLDVEGKIRMGSQTVDADSQDTVVTKGYLASYVTAALANSSNSLRVSGSNPSCPSGYVMTSRNWTSVCCGLASYCCPPNPANCSAYCVTGDGWKSASESGPTCQYWVAAYNQYMGCTSTIWSDVLCVK